MARIRSIKPAFFVDEDIMAIGPVARLMFIGMWCLADAAGRLEDKPLSIKLHTIPADGVDPNMILAELAAKRLIYRYEDRKTGKRYIAIPGFLKHQRPHKDERIFYPDPADCAPLATRDTPPAGATESPEKNLLTLVSVGVSPEKTGPMQCSPSGSPEKNLLEREKTAAGQDAADCGENASRASSENDSGPGKTSASREKNLPVQGKTSTSTLRGEDLREEGREERGERTPPHKYEPAEEPLLWPAGRWLHLYGIAWRDKYQQAYGPTTNDRKACGDLDAMLIGFGEEERLRLQTKAPWLFARYLAAGKAGTHPFAWFVERLNGLRIELARSGAASERKRVDTPPAIPAWRVDAKRATT